MARLLTDPQRKLIENIAVENDFKNYSIEEYSTSSKGDNYLSHMVCVTIKSTDKILDVIVKKAPEDADFRKVLPVKEMFTKEAYLYDTVFTTFTKFQDDMGLQTPFEGFAKFYGKIDDEFNECFVLENLVKCGYSVWNRRLPMTADHVELVMREYGKFHAASYALKHKNKEKFDSISSLFKKPEEEWERQSIKEFLKNSTETITKAIRGDSNLESANERFQQNIHQYFTDVFSEQSDEMIITHGDCWCNNMLFKYGDSLKPEKPTKVCLIDWQLSRYGLPMLDIAYFFVASSTKEKLYDYKKYLKMYHESLSQNLRDMSCDPNKILPFEELEMQWKKMAKYGMIIGGLIFKVLYMENDTKEPPEEGQSMKTMSDFYNQFEVYGDEEKINQRIVDLFNFMVDNNFI